MQSDLDENIERNAKRASRIHRPDRCGHSRCPEGALRHETTAGASVDTQNRQLIDTSKPAIN
jgi:hypothetical protein